MGEKDLYEKVLLSFKDVFADIVNVLLFNGDSIIFPEDLTDEEPHSYYYSQEHIHEQTQDVVKTWKSGHIQIACIGFENQTQPDPDMVFRVLGYEGARYRMQLNHKDHARYPVLTLILHYGSDHRWDKNLTLYQRLKIDPEFKKYVNDHRLNVFDIAYLDPRTVQMFQSDFRIVADYFVQMRMNKNYIPSDIEIKHVKETLHLLASVTDDERFETTYFGFEKEVPKNMCEVIDQYINMGLEQGRVQGLEQGRVQGLEQGRVQGLEQGRVQGLEQGRVQTMLLSVKALMENLHLSVDQAMEALNISETDRLLLRQML